MQSYLLVFFGGGLGAMLRHFINVTCARCIGTAFPYGTFIINITGSTVMGLIAGYLAFKGEASQPWRLFIMTGILGGYTTFSAFSLDSALLYERGETRPGRVLRGRIGGAVDRRPVRRSGAGAPSDLSAHGHPWDAHGYGVTSVCFAYATGLSRVGHHGLYRLNRLVRSPPERPGARR